MTTWLMALVFVAIWCAVAAVLIRSRWWALVCAGVAGYAAGLLVGSITALDALLAARR